MDNCFIYGKHGHHVAQYRHKKRIDREVQPKNKRGKDRGDHCDNLFLGEHGHQFKGFGGRL